MGCRDQRAYGGQLPESDANHALTKFATSMELI